MGKVSVNRNHQLAVLLLQLRRHLNSCQQCKAAIKAKSQDLLCRCTDDMILLIAARWDSNIPGRLAAQRGEEAAVFPCPDPNAHGAAYAISAEPVIVEAYIDRLL